MLIRLLSFKTIINSYFRKHNIRFADAESVLFDLMTLTIEEQIINQEKGKTRITIYLDNDVIEKFRDRSDAAGYGYQTMINEALKEYLSKKEEPVTESAIRQVIREELERAAQN